MCASSIFIYIPYIMFQTWYNWASQLKNHFIFSFLCSFSWESMLTKINLTNWISLPFHLIWLFIRTKKKKSKKSYLTWHLESERIAIIFTTYREGNQGPDFRRIRFRIYQYQNDVGFQTGKSRARTIRLHCFPPQRI